MTTQHPAPAQPDAQSSPDAQSAGEEITRYTSYTVFRRLGGLATEGEASPEQLTATVEETIALIEADGCEVLGFYDVSGFRAEADLMMWLAADEPEALQAGLRTLENSLAGTLLHREWAAVGVHRMAEFTRSHVPSFMTKGRGRKQWICVYPFVRSYEWYLLEEEERRRMLIEHGKLGRDFPQVNANTVASFALGDYEWLLSFEADDLHDLVDMMRHLRYSDARLHVREELPFHTGRRLESAADIAALLA
ncbi:chlorite dismutase family protein [Brachybacterium muris]|uniref:hydrogen peroxide-dependent heme synthase n=1 Tax=Brachybacterium muris TaxID=219301 RepID=UPI00195E67E5|nr:hydrogen peroxide-dependent heme synthase [Brachybacterium muris]MBM7501961.1 chlorite dismutase [Brachybacterium muris]MCT1431282.1 chlorite dismutase family protein [Brachybacterium muris]MCT1999072.1 chlorite dismutase family protein [Brachybacterium muris]MCT2178548.1 chlorite dismutase family protein [Brachybacterium muris]MCT2260258.1 chlorite dismutase family protein [Brachybacterium muris]